MQPHTVVEVANSPIYRGVSGRSLTYPSQVEYSGSARPVLRSELTLWWILTPTAVGAALCSLVDAVSLVAVTLHLVVLEISVL